MKTSNISLYYPRPLDKVLLFETKYASTRLLVRSHGRIPGTMEGVGVQRGGHGTSVYLVSLAKTTFTS